MSNPEFSEIFSDSEREQQIQHDSEMEECISNLQEEIDGLDRPIREQLSEIGNLQNALGSKGNECLELAEALKEIAEWPARITDEDGAQHAEEMIDVAREALKKWKARENEKVSP